MSSFFWTTDKKQAKKEQQTLHNLLKLDSSLQNLTEFNLGIAVGSAYEENTKRAFASAIFFDQEGKFIDEVKEANVEVFFPYEPGLLAFRVGPAICQILDDIVDQADLLVFDSQGIAHPRGFGLASHIGVLYNKPSIGVTKNILYGKYTNPPKDRFSYTEILHPKNNTSIGYSLSLGKTCQPCYISPGHCIGLKESIKIICNISGNSCFPQPIKRVHAQANKNAKNFWEKQKNVIKADIKML